LNGETPTDFNRVPIQFNTGQGIIVPLYIPRIAAGTSRALEISVTVSTSEPFQIRAWSNLPYFASPLRDNVLDWLTCAISVAAQFVPGTDCVKAVKQFIVDQFVAIGDL